MRRLIRKSRHGIAMLLVIVSLVTATLLSLAYLSSRDNSTAIGQNVASAASARWAAESGLQLGLAILETDSNWRTAHADGKLLDDYAIARGVIDIDLLDVGQDPHIPPTAESENIQVTVTANVNGVEQTAVALAYIPATPANSVDVDLSEFAIFAEQNILLKDNATLTRWPVAPQSTLGRRLAIGVHSTAASSIHITDDAAPVDTTVYHGPGASQFLVTDETGGDIPTVEIENDIPLPFAPDSGVSPPHPSLIHLILDVVGGVLNISADDRRSSMRLLNGLSMLISGIVHLVTDDDTELRNGAKMLIQGDTTMVVFGDLILDDASIELANSSARLTLFVRGGISLHNGYIGDLRTSGLRDNTGYASHMDPRRIQIFSMSNENGFQNWDITGNSVVKASIFSPDVRLRIREESALYGRAVAREVRIDGEGALFYDPALNSRRGYTNPGSRLFDALGGIRLEFQALSSLNPDEIQWIADVSGAVILPCGLGASYLPAGYVPSVPHASADGEVTPRIIDVDCSMLAFGTDMRTFE